jgi:hypothetical protein
MAGTTHDENCAACVIEAHYPRYTIVIDRFTGAAGPIAASFAMVGFEMGVKLALTDPEEMAAVADEFTRRVAEMSGWTVEATQNLDRRMADDLLAQLRDVAKDAAA